MTDRDFLLLESEKPKCRPKSFRLTVDLKSAENPRCPVFNYYKLLRMEKRRLDISDPAEDGLWKETDVARRVSYAELGAGYDENDSFIDNTDLQDEGMPVNFDTKRGGFYVNYGKLEFTKVYDDDNP